MTPPRRPSRIGRGFPESDEPAILVPVLATTQRSSTRLGVLPVSPVAEPDVHEVGDEALDFLGDPTPTWRQSWTPRPRVRKGFR